MQKICKHCDCFFDSRKNKQQCCSKECASAARIIVKRCEYCKKDFRNGRKPQRFCSKICAGLAKTYPPINCGYCGTLFQGESYRTKFCSRQCSDKGRKKKIDPIITRNCEFCGLEFSKKLHRIMETEGNRKFCGAKCATTYRAQENKRIAAEVRANATTKFCRQCSKPFKVFGGKVQRQTMCSVQCSATYGAGRVKTRDTGIERTVQGILSGMGVIYVQQFKVDKWRTDFYVPVANLIIECDGDYWHSRPATIEKDQRRDRFLNAKGYNILRLPESLINKHPEKCLELISQKIAAMSEPA